MKLKPELQKFEDILFQAVSMDNLFEHNQALLQQWANVLEEEAR